MSIVSGAHEGLSWSCFNVLLLNMPNRYVVSGDKVLSLLSGTRDSCFINQ